jgi:hypothetical protein
MYSEVLAGKHLFHNFPIQNGLKQGDALSPLHFSFALGYTIRKIEENHVGLKLNGTHQLLAYADDVNLLEDNIDTIKKKTETLIDASEEAGQKQTQKLSTCCYLFTSMQGKFMT